MSWFAFHTIRVLCFIKSAIPCSLATRVNSHVNPKLMRNIRVWQWRWMNSKSKNLLEVTGRSLKKRMAMWEEENIARVFKSKFPVNYSYRASSKMHFKLPENFKPILWNESIVSLWRKQHFFKTLTTVGAVFPPTGCLWTDFEANGSTWQENVALKSCELRVSQMVVLPNRCPGRAI